MSLKEANTTNAWQLYLWFRDPSRKWYNIIKIYLLSLGLVMSKADPALFYYHDNNNLNGMIARCVDDFLWSGKRNLKQMLF